MGKDLKGKELGTGIGQRADGRYYARLTRRNGERVQKTFEKFQECRKWFADEVYKDEHTDYSKPNDLTTDAWYEFWIKYKENTVKPKTLLNYEQNYKLHIKKVIGCMILKDVKPMNCQMIFDEMKKSGYKKTTMQSVRVTLHSMLEYAMDNDIIIKNPCNKSVKSNIGEKSEERIVYNVVQQKIFLEYIRNTCFENQYRLILQTGLRFGELSGLKWEDIDFEKREIRIVRSLNFNNKSKEWQISTPKTKNSVRTIPLTNEAILILKKQKKKIDKYKVLNLKWEGFVFVNSKYNPIYNDSYKDSLKSICENAGLPRITLHNLRHTFATRCIEAGMMPKTLQRILGHSNIQTTMDLYVHVTDDHKRDEMERISDYLNVI